MNNYSIFSLAKYILQLANQDNIAVTQIKLQKIAFFCYAFVLAKYNKNIVNKDFEAWKFGPVSVDLYEVINYKGAGFINLADIEDENGYAHPTIRNTKEKGLTEYREKIETIEDEEVLAAIKLVWNFYKDINAFDLVTESHKEGSPWSETKAKNERKITSDLVKEKYTFILTNFEKMLEKNDILDKKMIRATSIVNAFGSTLEYLSKT